MKQLPNNFTTQELSKRLLELGLPANSADCYYYYFTAAHPDYRIRQNEWELVPEFFTTNQNFPCWSVGRLIEIYGRCDKHEFNQGDLTVNARIHKNITDYLISRFILAVGVSELDFSKLEGQV